MLEVDILESQWKRMRGKVKRRWMALTEDEVKGIDGYVDMLIGLLQEKYGYTHQRAEEEVNRFIQENTRRELIH